MKNTIILTTDGFDKLNIELSDLIKNKRPTAIERLKRAREMGDLSENSEYTAAKEDLSFTEGRIQEIEEIIKRAEVVKNNNRNNIVDVGTKVKVLNNEKEEIIEIVGELEADPINKKLSSKSPIGKALIGTKPGDKVNISIPAGTISYKVLEIL